MFFIIIKKIEREKERFCFGFERRDFDFENVLKLEVVKPKTPTVTPKTLDLLSLYSGRNPKTKQILYDFICPHSASAFVFCSCTVALALALAHTHIDERDRERERILKREIRK